MSSALEFESAPSPLGSRLPQADGDSDWITPSIGLRVAGAVPRGNPAGAPASVPGNGASPAFWHPA
eukprot:11755038-Karenia_brevis.AAC.1